MPADPDEYAIFAYMKQHGLHYYAKARELRDAVEEWLGYIPATFPHYTKHSLGHSDEIVSQLSLLLFVDGDPGRPTVQLSPTETYILVAASYLHDTGMVVSDGAKIELLKSNEWAEWITRSGNTTRLEAVNNLRVSDSPANELARHFLADRQLRFLVAEFVRSTHHLRSADILEAHAGTLGRFDFGDVMLRAAIKDVCLAHGLDREQLENSVRYPERRVIRGDLVNIRFLAILLRVGDLLDMSVDRACPLLLSAASPLPADSLPRWTKYQRIEHRLTAPDVVELRASCANQSEHRFLQDWCQWLVDELERARRIMAGAERHRSWTPPRASLAGPSPTIVIRPSSEASYLPVDWRFSVDETTVLERFVFDVYDEPLAFVRELLQNAVDATRCKVYADLSMSSIPIPSEIKLLSDDICEKYPIEVRLYEMPRANEISGQIEQLHVVEINDNGIGMTTEVIVSYLLQIGRSYYQSTEFRSLYGFVPTSHYGIGFLTVFAVSDLVIVDTCPLDGTGGTRIELNGPRSYVLVEKSNRTSPGTSVRVYLRNPLASNVLSEYVRRLCPRVEFPISVAEFGVPLEISHEDPAQWTVSVQLAARSNAHFVIRSFPFGSQGVDGELYVFALSDDGVERWDRWTWAKYRYPEIHPAANVPSLPPKLACFHGMASTGLDRELYDRSRSTAVRCDIRMPGVSPGLSRRYPYLLGAVGTSSSGSDTGPGVIVSDAWREVVRTHFEECPLARDDHGWRYKQSVVDSLDDLDERIWDHVPGMVHLWFGSESKTLSLHGAKAVPVLSTVHFSSKDSVLDDVLVAESDAGILPSDARFFGRRIAEWLMKWRSIAAVRSAGSSALLIDWAEEPSERSSVLDGAMFASLFLAELPWADTAFVIIDRKKFGGYSSGSVIVNSVNAFGQILHSLNVLVDKPGCFMDRGQFAVLVQMIDKACRHPSVDGRRLADYLQQWNGLDVVPEDLRVSEAYIESWARGVVPNLRRYEF